MEDLLARGANPTTWAINGYYGTPTALHPIGSRRGRRGTPFRQVRADVDEAHGAASAVIAGGAASA